MSEYVFRSQWRLPADPDRVYALLADVEGYVDWWPQVRATRWLDERSGELTCRSMLPYDLTMVLTRELEDPAGHVLRARISGDLEGSGQWTVTAAPQGALAVFDEQVDLSRAGLRRVGFLVRPALRRNHDHMMRGGERGLQDHLRRAG